MAGRRKEDDSTGSLFRMLEDKLKLERSFGVEMIRVPSKATSPAEGKRPPIAPDAGGKATEPPASAPAPTPTDEAPHAAAASGAPAAPVGSKAEQLKALEDETRQCHKCALADTRTNYVFGVGNPEAELMFIGEAPGEDEDKQGEPFVGRAGQLLTKMIAAMGLKRSDVYIANILKCRPPENRNPRPNEIIHCLPILLRQIRIIRPKLIVALGGIAAQTLLQSRLSVGALRGKFHDYDDTKMFVTFHPAYLLRNPPDKSKAWDDMKMVMKFLGLPIPEK